MSLISSISLTSIVVPASWDSNGGNGTVAYLDGALIISQTEPIQRQIAKLLADLRAVRREQSTPATGSSGRCRMPAAVPLISAKAAQNTAGF